MLKGRKFEQSCISDRLSVSADISDPLSVIRISAKFQIGASLDSMAMKMATPTVVTSEVMMPLWSMED